MQSTRAMTRAVSLAVTLALTGLAGCGKSTDVPAAAPVAEFELIEARISDIQGAIQAGKLTSVQLVNLYLERIKAYNGTCVKQPDGILGKIETIPNAGQLNALATLNLRPETRKAMGFDDRKARSMTDALDSDPAMPDALQVAAELDRKFAETGKLVGPLHGVVMAVKDQYDTFDMRTTTGTDAFFANDRPPDDATFVKRLREAGAIVLAKSNLGEFASGIARSSFGGTFCNPYDTERTPGGSSSGSGSAVGANLVTCAIAEETGMSIRGPAYSNNSVGIAPTQELVSRDGMIQEGINTRVGPICRNVEDAAKVLQVIAGYDPKDELTAFAIGRMPEQPLDTYARETRLDGLRIGVVREYMNKAEFAAEDVQAIDLVSKAVTDLQGLGATMVDPGPEGALLDACVRKYYPSLENKVFASTHAKLFPTKADKPAGDHIKTLIDLSQDISLVPSDLTFRKLGGAPSTGEGRYALDRYLRERGDAKIKTTADFITQANYYKDANFPDHKQRHVRSIEQMELDMSSRMLNRFAVQTTVLQCMAEMGLDALVYPTGNMPPPKLGSPTPKDVNGRPGDGVWRFLGRNGFPVMTVPAGFTTQTYDHVRVEGSKDETRVVGPIDAKLPIGMDIVARPFDEPTLFRIASAYEAATKHRSPPPAFGPVKK